jgi:hypothetical protein
MCIIIDTNTWTPVTDTSAEEHAQFAPVYQFVFGENAIGKIVFGGSTYLKETPKKFLPLLKILTDKRRTIPLPTQMVDQREKELADLLTDPDFDDPHIVAMAQIALCKLVCTNEKRAIPFFKGTGKGKILWPKGMSKLIIYQNLKNAGILSPKNIHHKYLPVQRLSKTEANTLQTSTQSIHGH